MDEVVLADETLEKFRTWLAQCQFMEYNLCVNKNSRGEYYLQAHYLEACVDTGRQEYQFTRRWILSPHMVKGEVIQTAFKCCITSMEHRTREHFLYRGRRVFGPHFDIDVLWSVADQTEVRSDGDS